MACRTWSWRHAESETLQEKRDIGSETHPRSRVPPPPLSMRWAAGAGEVLGVMRCVPATYALRHCTDTRLALGQRPARLERPRSARSCWCCALACPGAGGAVPGRAFSQLLELRLYSCTCRLTYLVSQLSVQLCRRQSTPCDMACRWVGHVTPCLHARIFDYSCNF